MSQLVTVNSRKYDQSIGRTWTCELITRQDPLLILVGEFEHDTLHPDLGQIFTGTRSYEYYWLDRRYNIFRFHQPDGSFRNYYCNISMPPAFENNVLDYIDLDIDVLVWPDWTCTILDMEEFQTNTEVFGYTAEITRSATESLADLMTLIETRGFPFSDQEKLLP